MREPNAPVRRVRPAVFATALLAAAAGCLRNEERVTPPRIAGETRTLTFSSDDKGRVPRPWKVERTGRGEGSRWQVVADESSPSKSGYVLAQTAESPRSMFNLCIIDEGRYADLRLRVAFKAVEGEIDQGGGLVWRYVDANNYYVCRFNPLEDNLRIYKVIAGRRHQLASIDVELPAGQWQRLTVTMKGDLIVAEVNDTRLAVRDGTLTEAGRIGLWTKADARTHFDAFSVKGHNVGTAGNAKDQSEDDAPTTDMRGSVTGVVRFIGDPIPVSTKVAGSADLDFCGDHHSLEDYVIDPESRGICYVIVRLSGGDLKNWPAPEPAHLVLDNKDCRFHPHAAVLTVGSTIECRNSDPILHTTHAYFGESFNFALPHQGSHVKHTLRVRGLTQLRCDRHGWMNAFVWVGRHPFHAVTDARGEFHISNVPPGQYRIHLWHEQFGEHREAIVIRPGETTSEQFAYPVLEETSSK